jgi:uncharacterized protein YceH (UPF0502 family)
METVVTPPPAADGRMVLDASEIRVLAVLVEKEALVPDTYPLSLNALVAGCNQLSSRDPVMALDEDAVRATLQGLVQKKLVAEVTQAGARVAKYEHRMRIKWTLEQDKLVILAILMLRGMQTAGEIRSRSGRMHEFATVGDVETGLQFLIDKFPPLVARLPRAPGTKESRYMHLLGDDEVPTEDDAASGNPGRQGHAPAASRDERIAALEREVAQLRDEFAGLSQQFDSFRKQFE